MIRGTTPTFVLTIDETVDLTEASNVYVSFENDNVELVKKSGDSGVVVEAHQVSVYLTQEETLKFRKSMEVQLNWTYANGSRGCTKIVNVPVGKNLIEEVLQ